MKASKFCGRVNYTFSFILLTTIESFLNEPLFLTFKNDFSVIIDIFNKMCYFLSATATHLRKDQSFLS